MSNDTTRRRMLRLAGTGLVASVAGCASVANKLGDGSGTGTGTGTGGTPRPAERTTPVAADTTASPSRSDGGDGTASASTSDDEWSPSSVQIDPPATSLADAPIPSQPDTEYARLGTADADVTATLYGSWKCPYTQEFVLQQLPAYVEQYVRPGDLAIEFRSVAYEDGEPFLGPDAPRASRMGLAVWDVDPASYWEYFAHVFANQPQERHEWATLELFTRFAEAAGVRGVDRIKRAVRSGSYAGPVASTSRDAAALDIGAVPRLVLDGTVLAPTVTPDSTRAAVERHLRR